MSRNREWTIDTVKGLTVELYLPHCSASCSLDQGGFLFSLALRMTSQMRARISTFFLLKSQIFCLRVRSLVIAGVWHLVGVSLVV